MMMPPLTDVAACKRAVVIRQLECAALEAAIAIDRARRARPPLSAAARRIADEIVAAAERIRRAPPRPLPPLARSIIEHADRIRRSRWA
jgi:hypothetical protein